MRRSDLRPQERSFWRLFKEAGLDGSRRISYAEFEALARRGLRISTHQLPIEVLAGVWKVFDPSRTGMTSAGELARFFKRGTVVTATPAEAAAKRMERAREKEEAAAELKEEEEAAAAIAASAEPAGAEELRRLSDLITQRLAARTVPGVDNTQMLFRRNMSTASETMCYTEFRHMCRTELLMGVEEISSEDLWRLWLAIDVKAGGSITAGDFHRLLRQSAETTEAFDTRKLALAEAKEAQALRASLEYSSEMARVSASNAEAMEEEAMRLEVELAALATPTRTRVELPLSKYEPRHLRETLGVRTRGVGKSKSSPTLHSAKPSRRRPAAPAVSTDGDDPGARLVAEGLKLLAAEWDRQDRHDPHAEGEPRPAIQRLEQWLGTNHAPAPESPLHGARVAYESDPAHKGSPTKVRLPKLTGSP